METVLDDLESGACAEPNRLASRRAGAEYRVADQSG